MSRCMRGIAELYAALIIFAASIAVAGMVYAYVEARSLGPSRPGL